MPDAPTPPSDPDESSPQQAVTSSARLPGIALLDRHLRYPYTYLVLLVLSALDVIMTWIILSVGGREANPIAEAVIDRWGLNGMIVYKFVLIAVFILICEAVGSLRDSAGRSLSRISLAIAAVPVVWSLILLTRYA